MNYRVYYLKETMTKLKNEDWSKAEVERFLNQDFGKYRINVESNRIMHEYKYLKYSTPIEQRRQYEEESQLQPNELVDMSWWKSSLTEYREFVEIRPEFYHFARDFDVSFPVAFKTFTAGLFAMLRTCKRSGQKTSEKDKQDLQIAIEIYTEMLRLAEMYSQQMMKFLYPEWKEKLYCPHLPEHADSREFLVSFIWQHLPFFNKYPIISCSYVNDNLTETYLDRKVGLLYYPKDYEIIGMAADDAICAAVEFDDINYMMRGYKALEGYRSVGEQKYLCIYNTDFQSIFRMQDLEQTTGTYNEIILDGNTEPVGVFVREKDLDSCLRTVYSLCNLTGLPVIIPGTHGTRVYTAEHLEYRIRKLISDGCM